MEEKNEEKFSIDTENLKNETVETAKKIKETVKATNIKEETKATKGFIIDMFKNPLEKIKEVANDNSAKFFKTAIFLLIVWTVIVFISSIYSNIYYLGLARIFSKLLSLLKDILAPVVGILVSAVIVLVLNKENKKSLITVISTITITKIPVIASTLVSLLTIISSNISTLTTPFSKLCSVVAVVLGYFGFKNLFGEEDDKVFVKKYVLIQAIYYVAYIVIKLLGIYI